MTAPLGDRRMKPHEFVMTLDYSRRGLRPVAFDGERTHSRKCCFGKTSMQTFTASMNLSDEKQLD